MKFVQIPSFMSIGTMDIELREFKEKKKKKKKKEKKKKKKKKKKKEEEEKKEKIHMKNIFNSNMKKKWYFSEIFHTQFSF